MPLLFRYMRYGCDFEMNVNLIVPILLVRDVDLVREADGLRDGDASPLLHEEVQYLPDIVAVRPRA